jgi:predicted RNA-binding protein with TRAM domain
VTPSATPAAASAPATPAAPVAIPTDATVYTGTVVFVGKFGDGLVKVDGQSVYVPGVQKGERISFIITEKRDRFSAGQLVSKLEPVAESGHADAREARPAATERVVETKSPQIQVGQEHEVTITEKERRNPELAGVGRVDGLVVIVNGTKPGDRVKVRITERKPTLAFGEIVERLESAPAAP